MEKGWWIHNSLWNMILPADSAAAVTEGPSCSTPTSSNWKCLNWWLDRNKLPEQIMNHFCLHISVSGLLQIPTPSPWTLHITITSEYPSDLFPQLSRGNSEIHSANFVQWSELTQTVYPDPSKQIEALQIRAACLCGA